MNTESQRKQTSDKFSLSGDQMETHLLEELVLLRHHQGDGIGLLKVKGKLDAGGGVSKKIPPVLQSVEII